MPLLESIDVLFCALQGASPSTPGWMLDPSFVLAWFTYFRAAVDVVAEAAAAAAAAAVCCCLLFVAATAANVAAACCC